MYTVYFLYYLYEVTVLTAHIQGGEDMNVADEIEKLHKLKESGAITEKEYLDAKKSLLDKTKPSGDWLKKSVNQVSSDVNLWCMLIHLTQFCGYILPLAGMIVPIVLWQIKKDESPIVDTHGRIVVNWIISAILYWVIAVVLIFVLIGIPLVIVLGIVGIVFPIIGGIKAYNGEVWHYPFSMKFFK